MDGAGWASTAATTGAEAEASGAATGAGWGSTTAGAVWAAGGGAWSIGAAIAAPAASLFVWVVDPATQALRRAPVQTGPYGEDRVPILSGISETDWIIVAGAHLLREGQKVKPVDRDNRIIALAATP